jgi:hypothetical protein
MQIGSHRQEIEVWCACTKSMSDLWSGKSLYAQVSSLPVVFQGFGIEGAIARCDQVELVMKRTYQVSKEL